ncbi:MAG: diacylglycerol kinase family lipid kinase [Elusimicrobiaceae bacterium]|jgi:diacylglycerol kinase (ATP)|nr:diacylglycerol kinase family lipid kinase [Elusimicrobiaceae bacterium]MBT3955157.1 diacylglycerol kinase family lipid kinase [Elusimicrobiaceae bacterium]MBT4008690.1 diacylglycerol kinase family lipid kinase [Elusimicrobiaceae bacterium]MBT4402488.1 diacylglycerol kinase family lipid kinase [Elusimicrobiaceae bacterium]MBT4440148.1 diacylglycerol kinase family lipid kinase [Elusimicrobiaceae bacterium]
MDKFFFIINPKSGTAKDNASLEDFILKYFKDSQIHFTDYKGHAKELANQCVEDGFKNLAVVGGDGTINEVLSEIIDKDINLAVIPKGTGNGFARMMKIPLTPKKAIKSLKKWKPISCDIGKLNEDYFINIAGLGFDAFIAEKFNNLPSNLRKLGKIGYFQLALTEYLEYHHEEYQIEYYNDIGEKNIIDTRALMISFANGTQYGSDAEIAPEASINDGMLDMVVLPKHSLKNINSVGFMFIGSRNPVIKKSILKSKIIENPLKSIKLKKAKVLCKNEEDKILYHIDGEQRSANSLDIKVLPQAIKILKP